MNWEAIKKIYIEVLVHDAKIKYLGEDKYKITRYYLNGQKRWEFEYKNGIIHGKYIYYYLDGSTPYQSNWENGKRI